MTERWRWTETWINIIILLFIIIIIQEVFGLEDSPAIMVDQHGRILLWFLQGILSNQAQARVEIFEIEILISNPFWLSHSDLHQTERSKQEYQVTCTFAEKDHPAGISQGERSMAKWEEKLLEKVRVSSTGS